MWGNLSKHPKLEDSVVGVTEENPRNTSLSNSNKTEMCLAVLGSHKTESQDDLGSGT